MLGKTKRKRKGPAAHLHSQSPQSPGLRRCTAAARWHQKPANCPERTLPSHLRPGSAFGLGAHIRSRRASLRFAAGWRLSAPARFFGSPAAEDESSSSAQLRKASNLLSGSFSRDSWNLDALPRSPSSPPLTPTKETDPFSFLPASLRRRAHVLNSSGNRTVVRLHPVAFPLTARVRARERFWKLRLPGPVLLPETCHTFAHTQ